MLFLCTNLQPFENFVMLLKMERTKIPIMLLIAAFFALISKSNSQFRHAPAPVLAFPPIRPLCLTQFTFVNRACYMLPRPPMTPSTLTSPIAVDESSCSRNSTGHQHGHHHRHRHRHRHSSSISRSHTMAEEECCRWLKLVDAQCVCDLLLRLPPFLSKARHDYTAIVNEDCSVIYSCPGRIIV